MGFGTFYDYDGNVLSDVQAAKRLGDPNYQIVESTKFDEWDGDYDQPVHVSTVWLGLDHGHDGGDPVIFETMIFEGRFDGFCQRYSTYQEAVEGHWKVVHAVQGGGDPYYNQ